MSLVHVIPGGDGFVAGTEGEGKIGVAFERQMQRIFLLCDDGKEFAFHFVYQRFRTKGRFFGGGVFLEQDFAKDFEFHLLS